MATVNVSGLRELRTSLSKLDDPTAAQDVKKAFHDAADLVAVRARGRVPSRSGRAAGSIKAGSTGRSAYVKGGGGAVPYYGWLDFGTRNPRRGNPVSVGPWSGSGRGPDRGRYIYPTIDAEADRIVELIAKGLELLIKRAGLS